ncbi:conserved hypothetical protein [Onion yellows phytoplasma OY-M]|uniref:Uncharacterized protein n=1 Tax=Onion yellows phytoplasma (strain OY-M) TaxID=262768 RepID=Q6YQ73_ONYPE|nr:conserved hypothetical protein [Onion yellows phytoplasma OY-M]
MDNAKRKKSFYLKVSKLYLLISLLFFILNITYVFATTNNETQTYTSSSRAYKPHNEGEEKQLDWENPNTWDKVYDSNNKQISKRYFKEGSDEDNKQVNWDHDKTWDKTYYDGNFAEEVQAEEYILTERHYTSNSKEYKKIVNWNHDKTYDIELKIINNRPYKLNKRSYLNDNKEINWKSPNTWNRTLDDNSGHTLEQRHFKTSEDDIYWEHKETWNKEYQDNEMTKQTFFNSDGSEKTTSYSSSSEDDDSSMNVDLADGDASMDVNSEDDGGFVPLYSFGNKDDNVVITFVDDSKKEVLEQDENNNIKKQIRYTIEDDKKVDWENDETYDAEYDENNIKISETHYLRDSENEDEQKPIDYKKSWFFIPKSATTTIEETIEEGNPTVTLITVNNLITKKTTKTTIVGDEVRQSEITKEEDETTEVDKKDETTAENNEPVVPANTQSPEKEPQTKLTPKIVMGVLVTTIVVSLIYVYVKREQLFKK